MWSYLVALIWLTGTFLWALKKRFTIDLKCWVCNIATITTVKYDERRKKNRVIAQLTSLDTDSDDSDSEGWLCEDLHLNLNSPCTQTLLTDWLSGPTFFFFFLPLWSHKTNITYLLGCAFFRALQKMKGHWCKNWESNTQCDSLHYCHCYGLKKRSPLPETLRWHSQMIVKRTNFQSGEKRKHKPKNI